MTTPPEPRPSIGRSSFAIAMRDYTFIRPSIAVSIGVATLLAAVVIGVVLIQSLGSAAEMVRRGGQTAATLHSYNAALEVWGAMAARGDPRLERPEARELRDSIRAGLTVRFRELRAEMIHPIDRALVETVIESLREREVGLTADARQAMIELLARQDQALFGAAEEAEEAVLYVSMLLALTLVAAGLVIVPMAWLYIRYKRRGVIEGKG